MNRREALTAGGVGVVGLLLPQKAEAASHDLLDRGLSHEEMARRILDSNDICVLRSRASKYGGTHTIYPQYTTPEHSGGWWRQVHVLGSIITMVIFLQYDGSITSHERFDISNVVLRTIQIGWEDEHFGRMGERWFRLG